MTPSQDQAGNRVEEVPARLPNPYLPVVLLCVGIVLVCVIYVLV